jgi:hypothetical protein
MDPSSKGWLKKYLECRIDTCKHFEIHKSLLGDFSFNKHDQFLYSHIQPTGMIYGVPIRFPVFEYPKSMEWNEKSKLKIILTESFINYGLYFHNEMPRLDLLEELSEHIFQYYESIYPKLSLQSKHALRNKSPLEKAEYFIDKRLDIHTRSRQGFWVNFFQNSLIFLDVIYFSHWYQYKHGIDIPIELSDKKTLRLVLLKTIAAAANSNGIIEKEEQNLFDYFLKSAQLPAIMEEEARDFLHSGIGLDQINLNIQTWLLKKYFLEMAILTIWADRIVTHSERAFLNKLTIKLGLNKEDLDNSKLAIESFVVQNWKHVYYLQHKENYKIISDRLLNRAALITKRYKNRIGQEIHESKELIELLHKSRKTELSPEEKKKVRMQLIDILKTLPAFVIIALPGTFLTLPILLKILPKSAFPSAFQD